MSLSWKDTVATTSMVIAVGFAAALMMGAFQDIEARWTLGTFAIFLFGGLTGLITGTIQMMQNIWSSLGLYILSISALTVTVINAFMNSEILFIAMAATIALTWLEFIAIDLFATNSKKTKHLTRRGTI